MPAGFWTKRLPGDPSGLRKADDLADALHELECGWWATGTVPEMMEAVRVIVRGTVDRATEGTP